MNKIERGREGERERESKSEKKEKVRERKGSGEKFSFHEETGNWDSQANLELLQSNIN